MTKAIKITTCPYCNRGIHSERGPCKSEEEANACIHRAPAYEDDEDEDEETEL